MGTRRSYKCLRAECEVIIHRRKYCSILCSSICRTTLPLRECAYLPCKNLTKRIYCSGTCSNFAVPRKGISQKFPCIVCGKITDNPKYCSRRHSGDNKTDETFNRAVETGEIVGSSAQTMKKIVLKLYGAKCSIVTCGITEWQGQPVPLVMDHIDGNSDNNLLTNLRLVCGNCDMQLPTYKSKNKGKGRHSRQQRYAAGKSY